MKDEGGLNIEALSMGPDGALLIGLRTPVIGRDAVILVLKNPAETVLDGAAQRFRPDPVRLDLGGGGVRAMRWHPVLSGHLIGSRREDKGGTRFRLWFWSGDARDAPRPVEIVGDPDLEKLEFVARLAFDGREFVVLVFDSGDRKRGCGGEYMITPLEALSVQ